MHLLTLGHAGKPQRMLIPSKAFVLTKFSSCETILTLESLLLNILLNASGPCACCGSKSPKVIKTLSPALLKAATASTKNWRCFWGWPTNSSAALYSKYSANKMWVHKFWSANQTGLNTSTWLKKMHKFILILCNFS